MSGETITIDGFPIVLESTIIEEKSGEILVNGMIILEKEANSKE